MEPHENVYDYPGYPYFFIFKKVLCFLHFQKTETLIFLYQHLCSCVLPSVLMQLIFLLQFYFGGMSSAFPEGPVSQIHSPHLHVDAPGIISHLLRSVKMLKRERERERERESGVGKTTGSYRTYLPLGIIAALVPESAVKDLPLGRTF